MIGKSSQGKIKELLQLEKFRQWWRVSKSLIMRNRVIYWRKNNADRREWKMALTVCQRKQVQRGVGASGIARTTSLVKNRFAWHALHDDIKKYVAECKVCVMEKEEGERAKTKLGTVGANRP